MAIDQATLGVIQARATAAKVFLSEHYCCHASTVNPIADDVLALVRELDSVTDLTKMPMMQLAGALAEAKIRVVAINAEFNRRDDEMVGEPLEVMGDE